MVDSQLNLFTMQPTRRFPIALTFDDHSLTIAPAPPEIVEELIFTEKSLDQRTGTKRTRVRLFIELGAGQHGPVIQTDQGYRRRIETKARALGYEVQIYDRRQEFRQPRLSQMHGFRFSQKRLVIEALMQNQSGLIGAPTRYGKTTMLINILRAYDDVRTIVTVPGKDLIRQTFDVIKACFPHRNPKQIGGGKNPKPSDHLNVVSMDSLHKVDAGWPRLIVVDEPHAIAASSRIPELRKYGLARKLGLGATLSGRYDSRDPVIEGIIGPVLSNISYLEAVQEGAICPITVLNCIIKFDPWNCTDRNQVMRFLLWESKRVAELTRRISETLPYEWQTLMFIKNEDQAINTYQGLADSTVPVAMAKLLTSKERTRVTEDFKSGLTTRAICSDIWVQGVTFSDLRALLNLSGGGPYTSAVQKPGRLAEIRPEIGKRRGLLFDITFLPSWIPDSRQMPDQAWWGIVKEGEARLGVYRTTGYEIYDVHSYGDLNHYINYFANE